MKIVLVFYLCLHYIACASVKNVRKIRCAAEYNAETCQTEGCQQAASVVREMMDESTDPCQDFYQFSCGGYLEKNEIPDDRSDKSVFSDIEDEIQLKLKVLLERPLEGSEPRYIKMVKDFYDSCMNINAIDEAGSEPLKKMLNTLGGWPVVEGDSWDKDKFDWLETLFTLRRLGYDTDILLELSVGPDFQNNKINVIDIDQTSLGLPDRTYYMKGLNDPGTAAYFKLMVQVANKLGANEDTAEKEMKEAFNFETSLANISLPREERRNMSSLYNKYTVKKLQELAPQVNWLKYFNGLLNDPITEDETIIVQVPEFVKKFGELITKTDKRNIANYMIWRVVESSLDTLSKEWRDLTQEYNAEISGETEEPPRWEQCMSAIKEDLEIALSSYYVKNFFQEESKEKALELVKYIRQEFLNILENVDWMDEGTRMQAIDKANAIASFIGYPQELLEDAIILKYYENLTITNDNYFNNKRSLDKFDADSTYNELRKPHIKGDWKNHGNAAVVNAFYDPLENSIDFPAGILQGLFFNKDWPYYMNFGGIGSVIGHEITHGFDDTGRQFDKDGNNKNWWNAETDQKFREKAKCMIYQFGNFTAENGLQVNGINTLGENIADNGGWKEAYLAYVDWTKDNGEEKNLPGLKYTAKQLFWISAAMVGCEKNRPEALKMEILSGVHSPAKFRVLGVVSNIEEFANEFQCPLGSPMNPEKKCQVWNEFVSYPNMSSSLWPNNGFLVLLHLLFCIYNLNKLWF